MTWVIGRLDRVTRVLAICAVVAMVDASIVPAEPLTPDDAQFAQHHLTQALAAVFVDLPLAGTRVAVRPMPGAATDTLTAAVPTSPSLARQAVVAVLLAKGAAILPDSDEAAGFWQVRYDAIHMRMDCDREGWRGQHFRRRFRANLAMEVIDPTSQVVRARMMAVEGEDVIPAREADWLASPLVPRRITLRSHRLLQGVAIGALVAALVVASR